MIPLTTRVERGRLIIEIGIATLAHAYELSEHGQPFDEAKNAYVSCEVTDSKLFAEEVRDELEREREDGATPISMLLDEMCKKAVENGSQAVLHPAYRLNRPGRPSKK